jgi:CAAX protease family protein
MSIEPNSSRDETQQVASYGHLAVFAAVSCGLVLLQTLRPHWMEEHAGKNPHFVSAIPICLMAMAFDWGTVGFIWFGMRKYGVSISQLIGGDWRSPIAFLRDAGLGLVACVAWGMTGVLILYRVGAPSGAPKFLAHMMPKTLPELAFWLALSFSAGVAEELSFRGYLQRQLIALTKKSHVAVFSQGIAFGLMHAFQGWWNVAAIGVLGIVLGYLAWWRKSLRPGMIFHVLVDTIASVITYLYLR